jgi:hypothetical protein
VGILFAEIFDCFWYLIAIDSDISLQSLLSKFGIADAWSTGQVTAISKIRGNGGSIASLGNYAIALV